MKVTSRVNGGEPEPVKNRKEDARLHPELFTPDFEDVDADEWGEGHAGASYGRVGDDDTCSRCHGQNSQCPNCEGTGVGA